ncbi:serpin family protein [Chondromyces apiculatus]|uniref:Serine protease inhibitor n=1 Tax=Chondromyces apiculatus DSM 436 TaxID=1192034 RepID=A0A017T6F4_9BACT|nr:serpin family protein [Chondromyces apiculatus]EYF04151.1 serine protease inhibitor [Chondromyces apiculatus DSM 436]
MRNALCLLPLLAAACSPSGTTSTSTDTANTPASTNPAAPTTSAESAPSATPSTAPAESAAASASAATSPGPRLPPPTEAEAKALAASTNAFATDLYAQLRSEQGNLAVSPASISLALAMTWGGAKGETATQMAKVLRFSGNPDALFGSIGKQLATWNDPARTAYTLRVTNRLFGEKTYTFQDAFLKQTAATFGAPLESTDFRSSPSAPDAARVHINGWVAKETNDRIKDLLTTGALDTDTRLVLVNAVYFLGTWATPFSKDGTRPAPFHVGGTTAKDVPTMNLSSRFKYAATDGLRVLEMPYVGNELAMTLVLPDARNGLPAVEKKLTADKLTAWVDAAATKKVDVFLPSFEVSPPKSFLLNDPLTKLGMPLAFDRARADFTGIANPPNPSDRLSISRVFHKAFVKVDEKGTEAAAATGVVMSTRGMPRPEESVEFRADHPFLYFVRDLRSGMILFMGRVTDPSKS